MDGDSAPGSGATPAEVKAVEEELLGLVELSHPAAPLGGVGRVGSTRRLGRLLSEACQGGQAPAPGSRTRDSV